MYKIGMKIQSKYFPISIIMSRNIQGVNYCVEVVGNFKRFEKKSVETLFPE